MDEMNFPPEIIEVKKEKKEHKALKNFLKIILVLCLGFGSGLAGAYTYNRFIKKDVGNKPIIYQLPENSGTTVTTSLEIATENVVDNVKDSVVEIKTEFVTNSIYFQSYVSSGAGSGVIITQDGYIVTNNHVIEKATKVEVTLASGEIYPAVIIGADAETDLAILKIEATDLHAVVLGNSETLKVGQSVIAIGNPLGSLGGSVTSGIVSALSREITIENVAMNLLQTNAAVNPGNSGGGLFDLSGNLIGIVNAKSIGEDIEGIGFAIPIDNAKKVIMDLIDYGYVTGRFVLGVELVEINNQMTAYSYGVREYGIYISRVTEESNAARGGLKSGDRIISIDGTVIESIEQVSTIIKSHSINDVINIVVSRDGFERSLKITLEETKR